MLYCKVANNVSVGATAGTFDSIGSVTLRSDAKYIYGFLVSAALATATAAEAYNGILKINSADLGIGDQTFSAPPHLGGAAATNIGYSSQEIEFVPFFKKTNGKEVINISYSSANPDPTGAASVVVGVVYEAGSGGLSGNSIPADVLKTWPYMSPVSIGGVTASLASVTTVAATKIADMTVSAWAKEIVGLSSYMLPNLMTAGEERVGWIELQATIADFQPQEWPFVFGINAPLGTPVGQGVTLQNPPKLAVYIPKAQQNETVTAYSHLNAAVTTGDPVLVTLYYR